MLNPRTENLFINDPVPKNVSKYPIHQTYLTDDSERTGNGGYKFKAPEVWSSARSGKKSIAIRSISWLPKSFFLKFGLTVVISEDSTKTFTYSSLILPNYTLYGAMSEIQSEFNKWATSESIVCSLQYIYHSDTNILELYIPDASGQASFYFRIHDIDDDTKPSESFNIFINQPKDYFPAQTEKYEYPNVWDRYTSLQFHASFIPFDTYQYLGTVSDFYQNPIIFQDANSSPLFNIWTTTDLKTPLKILYESFIIRITFIISSDSQYS